MVILIRNNKYYCRFQINGERHYYLCKGAANKMEALKIENAFKYKVQQIQNGVIAKDINNHKIKMSELITLYENYSKLNNKGFNKDIYSLNIIRAYFKNIYVVDVTNQILEQFKDYLLNTRQLSNATVNRYRALLSKSFNLGIQNNYIKANPVTNFKKLKEKNIKVRFLSQQEEVNLLHSLKDFPLMFQAIIITALHTGMRKSEILNLKWDNVDMEYRFIELLETKSGKARRIPISETLYQTLNNLPKINEFVFVNIDTLCPYVDIKKSFKTLLKKSNIKDFRFHDLRHTVATRLTECNIDLVVVKELLGHSKIETTMRYAHAVPKRKIEAINMLNSYHQKSEKWIQNGYNNFDIQNNKKEHKPQFMYSSCF